VIDRLGGTASLVGHSPASVLALEAAIRRLPLDKVAAYEPPFIPEGSRPRPAPDVADRLRRFVEAGDRDGATALFQTEAVGLPPEMVEGMRQGERWSFFTRLAHTLPYDYGLFEPGLPVPAGRLARIDIPTLVITGSNTFRG
jgi:pimeloyl-ACP methyl ester carboxylesterase